MPARADHRPDLRLAAALTMATVGSCGGLTLWVWSVRERLPDPVARHWGLSGQADGFSSLVATLAVTAGTAVAMVLTLGSIAVLSRLPTIVRRWLAGAAGFVAVFLSIVVWDGLRGQLGLTDAALAPPPGPGLAVGSVVGMLAGVGVAALATPRSSSKTAPQRPPAHAPRLAQAHTDTAWKSSLPNMDMAVRLLACAIGIGFLALAAVVSWWLLPLGVVLVVLLVGTGRVRVHVDRDGLRASALGMTILHTPIEEVAEADVVEVDPFWEFGGWGLRIDTAGRVGLVTRKGSAVRIRRGDGSEVLVTLDESHHAAATLNSLADTVHGPA